MRLIDADKIEFHRLNDRVCPDLSAMDTVDEQPTVESMPVVHAHWSDEIGDIHSTGKFRVCSNCGGDVFIPYFSIQGINKVDFEYCPNCNATMNERGELKL